MILSAGYVGQLFGAIGFGWLAERIGRLRVLLITFLCSSPWTSRACSPGVRVDDFVPVPPGHRHRR